MRTLQLREATPGRVRPNDAKRLKELPEENRRLKKAVADLTVDKQILEEAVKGKW